MKNVIAFAAKYAKALVLVLLLGVAVLAQKLGVDIDVDPGTVGQALVAALLVYLVPNKGEER